MKRFSVLVMLFLLFTGSSGCTESETARMSTTPLITSGQEIVSHPIMDIQIIKKLGNIEDLEYLTISYDPYAEIYGSWRVTIDLKKYGGILKIKACSKNLEEAIDIAIGKINGWEVLSY